MMFDLEVLDPYHISADTSKHFLDVGYCKVVWIKLTFIISEKLKICHVKQVHAGLGVWLGNANLQSLTHSVRDTRNLIHSHTHRHGRKILIHFIKNARFVKCFK